MFLFLLFVDILIKIETYKILVDMFGNNASIRAVCPYCQQIHNINKMLTFCLSTSSLQFRRGFTICNTLITVTRV